MSAFPPKRRKHTEEPVKVETCNHFVIYEGVCCKFPSGGMLRPWELFMFQLLYLDPSRNRSQTNSIIIQMLMEKWEILNCVDMAEGVRKVIWCGNFLVLTNLRTSFMFLSYTPKLCSMAVQTRESFHSCHQWWANLVKPVPSAEEIGTIQGKISILKLTIPCHKHPLMNTMEDCMLLIHCLSVIYIWFPTDYAAVLYLLQLHILRSK